MIRFCSGAISHTRNSFAPLVRDRLHYATAPNHEHGHTDSSATLDLALETIQGFPILNTGFMCRSELYMIRFIMAPDLPCLNRFRPGKSGFYCSNPAAPRDPPISLLACSAHEIPIEFYCSISVLDYPFTELLI